MSKSAQSTKSSRSTKSIRTKVPELKQTKKKIIVFTDGSCVNNSRTYSSGGIGIHFPNGELKDISQIFREGRCTNQRTELFAILTAIRYVRKHFDLDQIELVIKTDSE